MFIYLIVNYKTGKYYVGQHKGDNLRAYLQRKLSAARHNEGRGGSYLFASMRKHPDPKAWSIHALRSDIQTRAELDQTERDFIKFLKATDPGYGYNICQGGEGFTGPHTEATRRKLSASIRKGMSTPEYRQRRSVISKEMWQKPGYREDHTMKLKETLANPEKRAEKARITTEAWLNNRASRTEANRIADKKAWSDPKKRAERVKAIKRGLADPDVRAKCGEASRQAWTDPGYRARMAKRKKRDYQDVSGSIQGGKASAPITNCLRWNVRRGKPCACGRH